MLTEVEETHRQAPRFPGGPPGGGGGTRTHDTTIMRHRLSKERRGNAALKCVSPTSWHRRAPLLPHGDILLPAPAFGVGGTIREI